MAARWPERLWIVRHGESAGNVARDMATASGLGRIDITERDVDVPLSRPHTPISAARHSESNQQEKEVRVFEFLMQHQLLQPGLIKAESPL